MAESSSGYDALTVTKKTGTERFHRNEQPMGDTLLDFWRWASSDLVSNATRGILAEYLVAGTLGLTTTTRIEWDAFDLITPTGIKVEVKSAAYLQSWYHKKLSTIRFAIRPTRFWNTISNELATEIKRQADIYVFWRTEASRQRNSRPNEPRPVGFLYPESFAPQREISYAEDHRACRLTKSEAATNIIQSTKSSDKCFSFRH